MEFPSSGDRPYPGPVTEHVPDELTDLSAVAGGNKGHFDLARAVWQRAARDSSEGAVEVAFVDDLIGLRNSAQPAGPVLVFTKPEWEAFVAGAQSGEFDL
jgi:Domain of unknown function (DUF397)